MARRPESRCNTVLLYQAGLCYVVKTSWIVVQVPGSRRRSSLIRKVTTKKEVLPTFDDNRTGCFLCT
ncbi:hypothetical protein Y1Q_0010842 [Alligator mississippiensis]|uniref:Uncharacterized protein n=1 Tax=Alligator mississippiensis TaxID=8496 RepID=A0A151M730_ALLMI|nr:hypothetical protein Y1Q_0010842 [Alligator mississippiensis]